jgi:hypothetical protein
MLAMVDVPKGEIAKSCPPCGHDDRLTEAAPFSNVAGVTQIQLRFPLEG